MRTISPSPSAEPPAGKPGEDADGDDSAPSHKVVLNEIFRDPRAEKLLDVDEFKPVIGPSVTDGEVLQFKAIAEGVDPNVDKALIDKVVHAMAAKLTDHANIMALINANTKSSPNSKTARAIQDATTNLIVPLFSARSHNTQAFLAVYNRVLLLRLVPLLKNHLIPRIQAMIVLGESGSTEMLPTYEAQIKDRDQTVWVKLWALEGMSNIIENGRRLGGTDQVNAAKVVADFLENEEEIPWPVQLRALEVFERHARRVRAESTEAGRDGQRGDAIAVR